ncbi:MAG: hypothetical protein WEC17_01445 [Candidatus Saccharimonadales bacterium]
MNGEQSIHSRLLEKIRSYTMPLVAQEILATHPPLVIAGITASGKNAATKYIVDTTDYRQVVTHTTRQPRPDEIHGKHYYFVKEEEMLKLLDSQSMIEAKLIHDIRISGISVRAYQDVVNAGHKPLLVIDVQGTEEISKFLPKLRPVFLLPPNFDTWVRMQEKRGRMSHSERLRRMHSAREELEQVLDNEHFFLVVNRDVPQTAREILGDVHDQASQRKAREAAQLLIDRLRTI